MVRIQKRLIHLMAQEIETGFCNGQLRLRKRPPRADEEEEGQTPWSANTAAGNAAAVREELLRRFLSRSSGFVTGTKHSANDEFVELPGAQGRSVGTVAAHQMITAYWATAVSKLSSKLAKQTFKHFSLFEDAAKVSTHEAGRP